MKRTLTATIGNYSRALNPNVPTEFQQSRGAKTHWPGHLSLEVITDERDLQGTLSLASDARDLEPIVRAMSSGQPVRVTIETIDSGSSKSPRATRTPARRTPAPRAR